MAAFVAPRSRKSVALALAAGAGLISFRAIAADSVTVVPGSLTQGSVKSSLGAGTSYAVETNNLGDWPLNTGTVGGSVTAVSITNPNFNGSSFGGTPNSIIAFGNGGGVTLKFASPVQPAAGEKDIGIFTAQAYTAGSGSQFNSNMEAAILVSADDVNWRTLAGAAVADPTTYIATSSALNAPTVAYNFQTTAAAWSDGSPGTSQANLSALAIADFTTPMPNDNVFNGTGTNADRLALASDNSAATYAAIFGASGGGNWFDVSGSGLAQINYLRLNGVNVPSSGGIRLDAVFANAAAVPEPAMIGFLGCGATLILSRRR